MNSVIAEKSIVAGSNPSFGVATASILDAGPSSSLSAIFVVCPGPRSPVNFNEFGLFNTIPICNALGNN